MTKHEEYMIAGGCPSTKPGSYGKVWCNEMADHIGCHWAGYRDEHDRFVRLYWQDGNDDVFMDA